MNYTKPQVAVLGEAVRVIESIPLLKGMYSTPDGVPKGTFNNAAYDLDE
jgi:hypothetical protein